MRVAKKQLRSVLLRGMLLLRGRGSCAGKGRQGEGRPVGLGVGLGSAALRPEGESVRNVRPSLTPHAARSLRPSLPP